MDNSERIRRGALEIGPKGSGYLRESGRRYRPHRDDAAVDAATIKRLDLRPGQIVTGSTGPDGRLDAILEIDGQPADSYVAPPEFDDLTAIDPRRPIRLEVGAQPLGMRVMDLLTPIGMGQRGLIVAPPRTGKTILIQQIAASVLANHPEMTVFVLLVDERPEEVTEMRRTIAAEVIASSSDRPHEEHIQLAELTVERAKRVAEQGGSALVLMDSLTRLARAYNKESATGRTMSGGVDIKALDIPKRLFGAARAFDEGGSLTILATCLIETGSRMDEVIFQEFKGTGNMEVVLDRRLADRRTWPAVDMFLSGTRKEERLLDAETLRVVTLLRRTLATMKPVEAMEALTKRLATFPSNREFLARIGQSGTPT